MPYSRIAGVLLSLPALVFPLYARPAAPASAHRPSEVLIVFNADSPVSTAIAHDYQGKRKVNNLVAVHCPDSALSASNETISLADFNSRIAAPVSHFLASHKGINFIVLTKGVPIRVNGGNTGSRDEGTTGNLKASVDSYLAAID